MTDTGLANVTVCHPEALSLAKVACARRVPVEDHRLPVCTPMLVDAL